MPWGESFLKLQERLRKTTPLVHDLRWGEERTKGMRAANFSRQGQQREDVLQSDWQKEVAEGTPR